VVKRCTSRWLADKYIEFIADQKMTLTKFARTIQKDWNLTTSRSKIARARRLAMQKVLGVEDEQYKHLWDYGYEFRRSKSQTNFYLKLNGNLFNTLYVAINACKRRFLSACRPIRSLSVQTLHRV
jgi:meiotically up-regulated gene 157 (Mug157) protein